MEVYDPERQCNKCGFKGTTDKWFSTHDRVTPGGKVVNEPKEFIQRTCRRCGFSWRERPLLEG